MGARAEVMTSVLQKILGWQRRTQSEGHHRTSREEPFDTRSYCEYSPGLRDKIRSDLSFHRSEGFPRTRITKRSCAIFFCFFFVFFFFFLFSFFHFFIFSFFHLSFFFDMLQEIRQQSSNPTMNAAVTGLAEAVRMMGQVGDETASRRHQSRETRTMCAKQRLRRVGLHVQRICWCARSCVSGLAESGKTVNDW